ncbi:MAG TPA: substrate-binding domain-containing protein [Chloroflexota bacterium]|nr:substrate-binding domain-containing protein [Chloroflexota bacterium]
MRSHRKLARIVSRIVPLLVLLAALPLSGTVRASNPRPHANIIIGYLVKTLTNPYFVAMEPVAKAEAQKLGVTLVYEAGKYDGDSATQTSQIDDLITRGAKAIVLIPSLSSAIVPAVRRATAKGITVIALDTATDPPDAATAFFATDNYEAGILNGLWARKLFNNSGKKPVIALLEGTPGSEVNSDRMNGFLNGFGSGFGANVRQYVVSDLVTQGDQGKGQTAMENALTKNPNINLVWTINEPAALGAATAIKARGLAGKITIVSMDGGCRGIRAVRDGIIDTDVMQFPAKMAKLGVDYAVKAAMGQKIPKLIDTGEVLVTKNPQPYVPWSPISFGLANCWG